MLKHHLNPEQALQAANDLQAAVMVPIHFGTFINSQDAAGDCGDVPEVLRAQSGGDEERGAAREREGRLEGERGQERHSRAQ
jgi:L-ascorbate metabolism protein UlaG (beta-lactamase superfamily)